MCEREIWVRVCVCVRERERERERRDGLLCFAPFLNDRFNWMSCGFQIDLNLSSPLSKKTKLVDAKLDRFAKITSGGHLINLTLAVLGNH